MGQSRGYPADEIARLRDDLADLFGLMAIPAEWTAAQPTQVVSALVDALVGMLGVAFVCVRWLDPEAGRPAEVLRVAESADRAAGVDLSLASARLGGEGEIGIIVAASPRSDFPRHTERLLIDVAANQATIGLQQAFAGSALVKKEAAEQRWAAAALRERESRAIVDTIPGLVAILTAAGEVDVVNHELVEYCGQPLEAMRQWGANGTVHQDDLPHVGQVFTHAIAAGLPYEFEGRIRRFDGVYRWCQVRGLPWRDGTGRVGRWYVVLTDVDERKRAEEALNRARSELAHVSRMTTLSALTASIAHEVNQPLSGIITNAGTCLRMLDAAPPNVDGARETARRTIRDANRAADVIARLRALFSKREFTPESLDLNEATREVIALSSSDLQRNRVVLDTDLADDLPTIAGDRIQLQQVILNLLRNASDAMVDVNDRPRHLLVRTERDGGDRVRVTVRDSGVGLPPESLDSVFEAFSTTKSGGMGIGLFVSRSIVERHQGRLWAEPNDSRLGATFAFSIPHDREMARPAEHDRRPSHTKV